MKPLVLLIVSLVQCSPYILGSIPKSQSMVNGWSQSTRPSVDAGVWTEEPWGYSGPIAVPEILPDGSLADVPEVAAARLAHLSALHAAFLDPRAADGDDGSYNVYKYGDNKYPYHDEHTSAMTGANQAAWQVETQYKPLPNPHAREAAAKAWRE